MNNKRVAPVWQRVFCGLICVGAILALPLDAVHGSYHGWSGVFLIISAVGGVYLFGCIALLGYLPGKLPGTEYVRFRGTSDWRNT